MDRVTDRDRERVSDSHMYRDMDTDIDMDTDRDRDNIFAEIGIPLPHFSINWHTLKRCRGNCRTAKDFCLYPNTGS